MFFLIGLSTLMLAFLGIFFPLLPTTPFVLLSAFCFSKSSPKLYQKLLRNTIFGPLITNWYAYGAIRPWEKALSTLMIILAFSYTLSLSSIHIVLKIGISFIGIGILIFILSRPNGLNTKKGGEKA